MTAIEEWKTIAEGVEVSTYGRIKRNGTIVIPSPKGGHGYLRVNVGIGERYVHRIVLSAFKSKPPGRDFANHINGNKRDNRLCNLEWSTNRENLLLAARQGVFSGKFQKRTPVKVTFPDGSTAIYPSQKEASIAIGGDEKGTSINKALRGDRKTTHGCKVEYVNNYVDSTELTLEDFGVI